MTLLPSTTRGLILDMDGVLWRDTTPIGDLAVIFERISALGLRVTLATNNSTRSVPQYLERFSNLGVHLEPWQVVTSSLAVADMLEKHFPAGTPIFAIGESGVYNALREKGFDLLPIEKAGQAQAVVMGIDRQITFEKMCEAALLVRNGKPFFATNPDKTFPTPRGEVPGAGAWLSIITTATGVEPQVAGKPFPYLLELALKRMRTAREETFVVGDRLETDIAGGQGIGCPTALVLSGVTTRPDAESWTPKVDIIAPDLANLVGA
jgi:4-nitrophenyl phosphatase